MSRSTCAKRGRTGCSFTLFCLAPHGVCPAPSVTLGAVSSYLAFSPLPRRMARRYVFCDTFRRPLLTRGAPMLSHGVLPWGVRTFLSQTETAASDRSGPTPRPKNDVLRIWQLALCAAQKREWGFGGTGARLASSGLFQGSEGGKSSSSERTV